MTFKDTRGRKSIVDFETVMDQHFSQFHKKYCVEKRWPFCFMCDTSGNVYHQR